LLLCGSRGAGQLCNDGEIVDISLQVFLANGDGTFSPGQAIEGSGFLSTVIADFDEDGKPDLVATDTYNGLWFFHGNGDGTFSNNPTHTSDGDFACGIGAADLNGDGHLDLVTSGVFVGQYEGYGADAGNLTSVLFGDGTGHFGTASVYVGDLSAYSLAIADFNGDGHPDVVTANQDADSAVVFVNDGQGGFAGPRGSWIGETLGPINAPLSNPMSVDIDGDGKPDLVLMEWNIPPDNNYQLTVLLNQGSFNFSAPIQSDAVPFEFGDFVLADFRGTGLPDFLAIGEDGTVDGVPNLSFAPNTGGGRFGSPTITTPTGAQGALGIGDFNGDGKLDFVAATGGMGSQARSILVTTFLGNGDGTFRTGPSQSFGNTSLAPVAIYVGDFNGDGKVDLLVFIEANVEEGQLYELFGKGDGSFQPAQLLFSNFGPMIVADVNHDGHPDIIEATFDESPGGSVLPVTFTIYLGQPDGSFVMGQTYSPYVDENVIPQWGYPNSAGSPYAPMIGDFNGDGNLDIAAFQSSPNGSGPINFVQFLLGNGDGTFTPTYNSFIFPSNIPTLAMDANGDGKADLVELNGLSSSYDVIPMTAGPSFQFALAGDPVAGPIGGGVVTLGIPSSASTTITLSSSDPAISVPTSITIPTGQISQEFNFTIGAGFNTTHVFSITAQSGSNSQITYGTVSTSGTAGFIGEAGGPTSWPNVNMAAGQTLSNLGVGVQPQGGYTGIVTYSCLGLDGIAQCQFDPINLILLPDSTTADAQWIMSVPAGTSEGSYQANFQITDGATIQNIPFTLNVGDFTMSLSPPVQQVLPTDVATYTLNLTSIYNYEGLVNLTCSGLPADATCPSGGIDPLPSGSESPFPISTQAVLTGNYPFTVTGVSSPLTHSVSGTLQVWDFGPSVSPLSATVQSGGSATFTITVASLNGFSGTVGFWCQCPHPLTSSFSPASVSVPANGSVTSALTLTAESQTGSARRSQPGQWLPILALMLPCGIVLLLGGKRKRTAALTLLLLLGCLLSCGGGSSSGGGGGQGGTPYSATIYATFGNDQKTVGTITVTVD
jgi:hypothetical protein